MKQPKIGDLVNFDPWKNRPQIGYITDISEKDIHVIFFDDITFLYKITIKDFNLNYDIL